MLLQAVAAIAPRGIYICGSTSSSAGLTVSVVKDALTGGFVFEAGALVMADGGICCIDEFDKMSSEHKVCGLRRRDEANAMHVDVGKPLYDARRHVQDALILTVIV